MAVEITRNVYLKMLVHSQENGLIKVVTGISRCGKSYLLFNSFYDYLLSKGVGESHIIEIPLNDRGYRKLKNIGALFDYVKEKIEDKDNYYIFLDEIQLSEDYKEVIKRLLSIENVDIYITGKDLHFLKNKLMVEFADECQEIRVRPFTYREIMSLYEKSDSESVLSNYMLYGGLPMTWWMENTKEKLQYLNDAYVKGYILEYIEKYKIKNVCEFDNVIDMLAEAVGQLTNPLQLCNEFNEKKYGSITDKTVKKYINYLQDECMISKVLRYDIKKRKYISTPAKYYFEDVGLRNMLLNFEDLHEESIMENLIYNELMSRGYKVDIGVVELNVRDENGKNKKVQLHVDFMVSKGDRRYYVQSVHSEDIYELAKKIEYKWKTLNYIKDSFKKIMVVKDNIKLKRDEYGIVTMGLKEFLLEEKSLEL